MESRKQIKVKAMALEPAIRIGKNGITYSVIAEISKHLKKKNIVKVKLLSAFLEGHDKKYRKEVALDVAKKTDSQLIGITGFVFVLYRPRQ